MADKKKKIEILYRGKKYELVFNLNVMELVQEEYGSVEAWGNLTEAEDEPNAKALKFGLGAMINEGIDIYNDDHEENKREFFTDKQIGRLITEVGLQNIAKSINKTVVESTKSDEKKLVIHEQVADPTINFSWFRFIGFKKLGFTRHEVGRLTLREFNQEYQIYKDDFDMELMLKLTKTTYAKAKLKAQQAEEWL